jgi:hypothetical protein
MCSLCVFALRRQSFSKGDSLFLNTSKLSVLAAIEESPHQIQSSNKTRNQRTTSASLPQFDTKEES